MPGMQAGSPTQGPYHAINELEKCALCGPEEFKIISNNCSRYDKLGSELTVEEFDISMMPYSMLFQHLTTCAPGQTLPCSPATNIALPLWSQVYVTGSAKTLHVCVIYTSLQKQL